MNNEILGKSWARATILSFWVIFAVRFIRGIGFIGVFELCVVGGFDHGGERIGWHGGMGGLACEWIEGKGRDTLRDILFIYLLFIYWDMIYIYIP
jgi:hypothetical protein